MLSILEKMRSTRPSTTADLRARLGEIEAEIPIALAALRAADAERSAGLLDLDDRALEAIEAKLAKARRDADRLAAARGEVERRLADAETAEIRAVLDAERAAVEARAAKLASSLRRDYEAAGAKIVALLTELAAVEEDVRALNRRLAEAGRHDDALPGVEPRAISPGQNLPELVSIVAMTSLRPVGACPGWGAAGRAADALGLKS